MNTLKTAMVVLMLLAVLFGVYTVLNRPEPRPPKEVAWLKAKDIETPLVEDGSATSVSTEPLSRDRDTSPPAAKRAWGSLAKETPADASDPRSTIANRTDETAAPPASPKRPAFVPPPDLTSTDKSKISEPTASDPPPSSRPFRDANPVAPATSPYDSAKTSVEQQLPVDPYERRSPARGMGRSQAADPALKSESVAPQVQLNPYARDAKAAPARATSVGHYTKNLVFERAWQAAQTQIADERWREALLTLSSTYLDPKLTSAERTKLLDLLDPLAAKVIYSNEHLAESPYVVRRGDTLFTIADQYHVPWQLLQNMNDVRNPEVLVPGDKMKVVRGPFQASIDLAASEITLFCQRLYAGRFPIEIGNDPAPSAGDYEVRAKELGRAYSSQDGRTLAPEDPRNPYGRCFIDIGRELAIHGSAADPRGPGGCISLSPKDADDIFGILSQGSRVTIRR